MNITLLGAAGDVTGSAYLVEAEASTVLVDFGLFQGSRELEAKNRLPDEIDGNQLDAVLVTHAHLDHTGRLPLLAKSGYQGPIHGTDATLEMAALILRDSAHIQEWDARKENRRRSRAGENPVQPLYGEQDVEATLKLLREAPYDQSIQIAAGISARWVEAGHMLGSTSIELIVVEEGRQKVILFSGDIGPTGTPWLRDAVPFQDADLVFLESTYGNRDHRSLRDTLGEAREIIRNAVTKRGPILIPAFAIGRSQQMLYHTAALFRDDVVERFPVFLDSPMAIAATRIYADHPELFDEEAMELIREGQLQEDMSAVRIAETVEQSKSINDTAGPFMVIASSGMCTAGRIVHHLRHHLWKPETTVIIVGYQAHGSLGRRLVDGADHVRIFGDQIAVRADVHTLGGFSAHAGQTQLLRWFDAVAPSAPQIVLTHGEARGRDALAASIKRHYGFEVQCPLLGDTITM